MPKRPNATTPALIALSAVIFMLWALHASAVELSVGLGTCNGGGDWCAKPTAKLSLSQTLYAWRPGSVLPRGAMVKLTVDHYSRWHDGEHRLGQSRERRGDDGVEIGTIEFIIPLGRR